MVYGFGLVGKAGAWHSMKCGLAGMAWYMVWLGRLGMVYGMAWCAHDIWYGLAVMA